MSVIKDFQKSPIARLNGSTSAFTSPDKYWEARVADHICEGAFASTTVALYVVEIVSKTNAADRHVIFSSDDCCYKDHIPAVALRNRKSLQNTIKQSPLIGLQEISSVGIAISDKYKNKNKRSS